MHDAVLDQEIQCDQLRELIMKRPFFRPLHTIKRKGSVATETNSPLRKKKNIKKFS